jgi:hypothetical protein
MMSKLIHSILSSLIFFSYVTVCADNVLPSLPERIREASRREQVYQTRYRDFFNQAAAAKNLLERAEEFHRTCQCTHTLTSCTTALEQLQMYYKKLTMHREVLSAQSKQLNISRGLSSEDATELLTWNRELRKNILNLQENYLDTISYLAKQRDKLRSIKKYRVRGRIFVKFHPLMRRP